MSNNVSQIARVRGLFAAACVLFVVSLPFGVSWAGRRMCCTPRMSMKTEIPPTARLIGRLLLMAALRSRGR